MATKRSSKMFMKNKNNKKTNLLTRILHDKKGIYVTTAMKIVIAIVLGITTLTGTTYVMKDVVIPQTTNKIEEAFDKDYSAEGGGSGGGVPDDPDAPSAEIIPEGLTYTVSATGQVLDGNLGDHYPATPATGDTCEDYYYIYTYNRGDEGEGMDFGTEWSAVVKDTSMSAYGTIQSEIAGKPVNNMCMTYCMCQDLSEAPYIPSSVTDMPYTFQHCTSLTSPPEIPSSVTNMYYAFGGCSSLAYAPTLPDNVTNIKSAFINCSSLEYAPVIPNSVTDMSWAFSCCYSLTGALECNADPSLYESCLEFTQITEITGSCSQATKDALLATINPL